MALDATEKDALAAGISFASELASADPNELIRIFEFARRAAGTEVEREMMQVVLAMRAAAVEQAKLADAAIAMIEACSAIVDQSTFAAARSSDVGTQLQ